ncbi:LemA family protein [Rhodococcus artemisiae]|uniref:LemA family protein n=1 Tax=Rhodococcus artemisiae TaxID=714159 RepID=A0ABU7LII1_9NOCA|nr:LemA family protein [Rhodococcus artemisiae]MEE2061042.1 LemA family protein [Rhodococcus artemisiae]
MTPVALVIVVAVVAVALLWIRLGMRRLRTLRTRRRDGLHLLLNELDDRYDLIPALIAASAGAGVERSRISPVVGARSLAIAMRDQRIDLPERAATENALSAALHELIGVLDGVNHWPFIRVARELQTREQRIAGAVRVHNDLADKLNSQVSSFPTSLFAKLAGVRAVAVFEVPAGLATETETTPVTEAPVTEQQAEGQAPTSAKTDEKDSGTVAA